MNWRYLGFAPAALAVASHVFAPWMSHDVASHALSPHSVEPFPMWSSPDLTRTEISWQTGRLEVRHGSEATSLHS
jgi:hypothetical protein